MVDLADAFLVMVLGMGGVFCFLVVLVLVMRSIVALAPHRALQRSPARPASPAAGANDQQLIAVLQAAVHAYERDTRP